MRLYETAALSAYCRVKRVRVDSDMSSCQTGLKLQLHDRIYRALGIGPKGSVEAEQPRASRQSKRTKTRRSLHVHVVPLKKREEKKKEGMATLCGEWNDAKFD